MTTKLRLGSLVSPVTFRHPSVLARAAVTVDHISGGRVEVGIGGGWMEAEHRAFGFPFPETSVRMEMLAEQLEIVHRQWTEDGFDFAGRHYALESTHRAAEAGAAAAPAADRRRRGARGHARARPCAGRTSTTRRSRPTTRSSSAGGGCSRSANARGASLCVSR